MDGSELALPGSVAQGHRQGPVLGCSPAALGASAASSAAGRCSAPLPRGCLNGAPRQAAALGRAAPLCLPAQPPVGPLEHHSGPCYHLPAVPALAPTSLGWQRAPRSPGEPWPSPPGPSLAAAAASICLMAPAAALAPAGVTVGGFGSTSAPAPAAGASQGTAWLLGQAIGCALAWRRSFPALFSLLKTFI